MSTRLDRESSEVDGEFILLTAGRGSSWWRGRRRAGGSGRGAGSSPSLVLFDGSASVELGSGRSVCRRRTLLLLLLLLHMHIEGTASSCIEHVSARRIRVLRADTRVVLGAPTVIARASNDAAVPGEVARAEALDTIA